VNALLLPQWKQCNCKDRARVPTPEKWANIVAQDFDSGLEKSDAFESDTTQLADEDRTAIRMIALRLACVRYSHMERRIHD